MTTRFRNVTYATLILAATRCRTHWILSRLLHTYSTMGSTMAMILSCASDEVKSESLILVPMVKLRNFRSSMSRWSGWKPCPSRVSRIYKAKRELI